jgi:hypothetical protein
LHAVAAFRCRRHTEEPLSALAARFGHSRAHSVSNLTRRAESQLPSSTEFTDELVKILRCCRQQQTLTPSNQISK